MKKIIIALAVALLGGCSDDKSASVEKPVTAVAAAQPVAAIEVPKAPAAPIHNYSLDEDGEYGYEGAISENDKNNGVAASKVLMFRYLGEKNGVYTVQIKDGNVSQLTSCKAPCDFVKNKRYFAGQLVATETIRAGDTSIIHAVLEDAQNGFLKPYQASTR